MTSTSTDQTRTYRVIVRRAAHAPDHWGVQIRDGYTDGKASWRLATRERFWSRHAAELWIAGQK